MLNAPGLASSRRFGSRLDFGCPAPSWTFSGFAKAAQPGPVAAQSGLQNSACSRLLSARGQQW